MVDYHFSDIVIIEYMDGARRVYYCAKETIGSKSGILLDRHSFLIRVRCRWDFLQVCIRKWTSYDIKKSAHRHPWRELCRTIHDTKNLICRTLVAYST